MFGLLYLQKYVNTAFISRMAAVKTASLPANPKFDKGDRGIILFGNCLI